MILCAARLLSLNKHPTSLWCNCRLSTSANSILFQQTQGTLNDKVSFSAGSNKMKIVIIEDEVQAARRLQSLLKEVVPNASVRATLDSVKSAVAWFSNNAAPDVALMDIQLADGISFQIFEQCEVACPVIFTTAYDEYALKAFKVNSIDYILKPIDKNELEQAFKKLVKKASEPPQQVLGQIEQAMRMLTKKFKTRFMIKVGEHLRTIDVESILYFYSQEKTTFCHTTEKRDHILDYTLDQLEELIDGQQFFRVNRQYIIHASAIHDIINYTNSRLRLVLADLKEGEVIVARERVQEFKSWLDQ
jgi:DNA-binding LytR/AlgR family response regulator